MQTRLNPGWVASVNTSGAPTGPFRLFPATNGPGALPADTSSYVMGLSFKVTSPGLSFKGWWWWIDDPVNQSLGGFPFGVWQSTGAGTGTFVAGSNVSSGTFAAGWNFVTFAGSLPLTPGQEYRAVVGVTNGGTANSYSLAGHFWDSGAGAAGIVTGPLTAFSAPGNATNPEPSGDGQMTFISGVSDVTLNYPVSEFNQSWYGLDVQVG